MNLIDHFAQSFDSIKVDRPAAAPQTPAFAADGTPALFAAKEAPGFYLLDDADGRFTIDRETGIVSVMHDHYLSLEAGLVHPVHIKVIEQSGATYDLRFSLRMTGRVPQIAGSEEYDALANIAAAPLLDLMDTTPAIEAIIAPAPAPVSATQPWTTFAAGRAHNAFSPLGSAHARFGALIETPPLSATIAVTGRLSLDAAPPAPSAPTAVWAI